MKARTPLRPSFGAIRSYYRIVIVPSRHQNNVRHHGRQ